MLQIIIHSKFVKFCVVGAVSTVIDVIVLYALVEFIHMNLFVGASISLIVASIHGYTLNRIFTFQNINPNIKSQFVLYFIVSAVGLVLTLLLLKLFVDFMEIYYIYAKLVTVLLVTAWNFTINHLFVFRNS